MKLVIKQSPSVPPVTSVRFDPNIFLSTILTNNLSLRYSLNAREPSFTSIKKNNRQKYKSNSIYFNLYISDSKLEDKRFWFTIELTDENVFIILV
jgi:hypothetical protein